MSNEDLSLRIVYFAGHCGCNADPSGFARLRGWIDPHGRPTPDGHSLISALEDQDGTRSVFRSVA